MGFLDIGVRETKFSPIGLPKTLRQDRATGHLSVVRKEPDRFGINAQAPNAEEHCVAEKCRDQSHDGSFDRTKG